MNKSKDYGPLWQIEQQIKHYESLASNHRNDAARSLVRADEADAMARRYRVAFDALEQVKP